MHSYVPCVGLFILYNAGTQKLSFAITKNVISEKENTYGR